MTRRLPAAPAPGPLEGYSAQFDDLFDTLAGRQSRMNAYCNWAGHNGQSDTPGSSKTPSTSAIPGRSRTRWYVC